MEGLSWACSATTLLSWCCCQNSFHHPWLQRRPLGAMSSASAAPQAPRPVSPPRPSLHLPQPSPSLRPSQTLHHFLGPPSLSLPIPKPTVPQWPEIAPGGSSGLCPIAVLRVLRVAGTASMWPLRRHHSLACLEASGTTGILVTSSSLGCPHPQAPVPPLPPASPTPWAENWQPLRGCSWLQPVPPPPLLMHSPSSSLTLCFPRPFCGSGHSRHTLSPSPCNKIQSYTQLFPLFFQTRCPERF